MQKTITDPDTLGPSQLKGIQSEEASQKRK